METTWYEVQRAIHNWAEQDWIDGNYTNEDDMHQWAHETADSNEYVIYYHHQNDLWASSIEIREYEEYAQGEDIQDRIMQCVYYAMYDELILAATEQMEHNSVLGVRQVETMRRIAGEWVTFPILETYRAPRKR